MGLSRRYAPHMAGLIILAMIPVTVHSYLDVRQDDCADPLRLAPASHRGGTSEERDTYLRKRFRAFQWREGSVRGNPPLSYGIIRSYDAPRIYYKLDYNYLREDADKAWMEELQVGNARIPVHRLRYDPLPGSSAATVAAYMLIYDGEAVENAYWNQLLAAPRRLLTGRLPMTAYFIHGVVPVSQIETTEARQAEWLRSSWQSYRAICSRPAR